MPTDKAADPPRRDSPVDVQRTRQGLWLGTALLVALLLASVTAFLALDRRQRLDQFQALSERRAGRLADELSAGLDLAAVAVARLDARLLGLPPGQGAAKAESEVLAEQAPLLAALALPLRLVPLAADGKPLVADAAAEAPAALPTAGGWQVELSRGPAGRRVLPLLHRATSNPHGVAAYRVELDHQALLARLERSRVPAGGSAAVFRLEPDGATTVLVRAPHGDAELGQRVRGPLAAALARAPHGSFSALTQLDNTRRTVAYRRLPGEAAALVVAYGVAEDQVLAEWRAQLPWAAAATLLLLGGIAAGARRLDRALRGQAQQQHALARSEMHFRALAANLPDVVVRLDGDGRHLYANEAVQQATGLPPQEFIGKTNAEMGMPAENVAQWQAALRRAFDSGQPERLEFTFPSPQGVRYWESLIALEPRLPGEPRTALVISRDITERRRADDARATLHRRLAEVLESMSDGFVSLDRQWRYVAVNAKGGQLLGRDAASLVGKHIWTEFPEGVGQPFHRAYERAMNEGVTVVMEEHYQPWDRWFENRIHPDAQGISIFFTDITDRRRVQQALLDSEARYRQLFERTPVPMWVYDRSDLRLLAVNEAFCRHYGYTPNEALAMRLPDFYPADEREAIVALAHSLAGHAYVGEWHHLKKDGSRITIEARSHDIELDGRTARIAAITDISARKAAEQALQQSEQRLREAQQLASIGSWALDMRSGALEWSDEHFRIFELDPAHFEGSYEHFLATIHPEDRAAVDQAWRRAVVDRADYNVTHRLLMPDGRIKHVQERGRASYAEDGTPLRALGTVQDITTRIQAEQALRDSEERLRLALQSANQGLYDLDLRTGEAVVSPEYATMLGHDPAQFHETNAAWRERMHPDDRPAVEQVYLDYVAGRRPDYRVEFRQRTRDGGWKWVLSLGRIQQRAADGTPLRMLGTHTDLDPIKAAQAAELAATQRFEKLFKAAPEAMSVSELETGRFLQVNDAFCELFGHPREAVIGRTSQELAMWTRPGGRTEIVARVRAGQPVRGVEGLARRGSGETVEVLFSAERIEFGGHEALLLMFRDISEGKQLEAALKATQARLSHLLARAPTVIYTARAQGDFGATYYSPNLAGQLGWRPEQFTADSSFWLDHVHPDDRSGVLQAMESLETTGELVLEYRFQHADGSWRWMRDQVSLERDASGQATEVVGAWIDITARHEAEDQVRQLAAQLEQRVQDRTALLARSEARYRTIFDTVPVAISEEDWSGAQRLLRGLRDQGINDVEGYFASHPDFVHQCLRAVKVQRLNQKAMALHDMKHFDRASPDRNDLQVFFPSETDETQFVDELTALWRGQRLVTAKRSLPSVTGRPLSLMMTMSLPGLDDADSLALVCLVDITEIDRLNAELDRSVERLQKVNRELETFTYSVSHDLKAPLRGIDGYSRLLLADHLDRLDEEGRTFLQHIRRATQHMGVLIDDLLTYSRLERRELAIGPMPLADVVQNVLEGYRQDMAAWGVQLEVKVDPRLRARADGQGLIMALRNLVDNALKFSRKAQPPRLWIEATRSGGWVQLSVRDNGVGFDMRFQDRIFSIFQRLHRAEDYPGTGIGLAIVRKAMERMGGQVSACSQPGEGASFTLQLPEADAP